jgi:hypothetical protein
VASDSRPDSPGSRGTLEAGDESYVDRDVVVAATRERLRLSHPCHYVKTRMHSGEAEAMITDLPTQPYRCLCNLLFRGQPEPEGSFGGLNSHRRLGGSHRKPSGSSRQFFPEGE